MPLIYERGRDAIAAAVRAIPDNGQVHTYERSFLSEEEFYALFGHTLIDGTQVIRGWTLTREETTPDDGNADLRGRGREYRFVLRAYHSVDEHSTPPSEHMFQLMLERTLNDLDGRLDYGLTDVGGDARQVSIRRVDYELFGGVICHFAELLVPFWAEQAYPSGFTD